MNMPDPTSRNAGLTLIELVVVMAIFGLVAVMGVQSLTGTLRMSDRLLGIDKATAQTGTAIALLRHDLSSVVPMLFYPPNGAPRAAVWQSADAETFSLSLAGQPSLGQVATDRHNAEWHFDSSSGQLLRRHWPTLLPVQQNEVSEDMIVLDGLTGMSLRTWWGDVGWVPGATAPANLITADIEIAIDQDVAGPPPAAYYSNLPYAVEITLQLQQGGAIRILQALK